MTSVGFFKESYSGKKNGSNADALLKLSEDSAVSVVTLFLYFSVATQTGVGFGCVYIARMYLLSHDILQGHHSQASDLTADMLLSNAVRDAVFAHHSLSDRRKDRLRVQSSLLSPQHWNVTDMAQNGIELLSNPTQVVTYATSRVPRTASNVLEDSHVITSCSLQ